MVVILHRRLGTTYRSHLDFLALQDATDRLSRNVGNGLPPTLRNIPEERGSQPHTYIVPRIRISTATSYEKHKVGSFKIAGFENSYS